VSRMLRTLLVLLVLADLAFVYITEAASWVWLGPLVGLTIASPALLPLRRHLLYRLLWNAAVVGVFALLVHHATNRGVQYLLEDGLLLAALCQVHLLNNIGPDQKPDLLFFNSFLIPVVTSFLSLDLGYLIVFLVYAPLLVLALQVLVLTRTPGGDRPGMTAVVLRTGLLRSAVVLGLTLAVFFFWPRDFQRKGLLGNRLKFRPPAGFARVDFSDRVALGKLGRQATASDHVVMKVGLIRGDARSVPAHWRGATLDRFDGRDWEPDPGARSPDGSPWARTRDGAFFRGSGAAKILVWVRYIHEGRPQIFVPLEGRWLELRSAGTWRAQALPDLTLHMTRDPGDHPLLHYEVGFPDRRPKPSKVPRPRVVHVRLEPSTVPDGAIELAQRLTAEGGSRREQVERMRRCLATTFAYVPPGGDGGAADLEEFFSGEAGGHCDYFATALAVMLRSRGIPCRLVTGYRSSEWDAAEQVLTIRQRHAHAWVEVLDPTGGWYTVDPSDGAGAGSGDGLLAGLGAALRRFWVRLTGFDDDARQRALAALSALPGRVAAGARAYPFSAFCVIALLGVMLSSRIRRRLARRPAEVRHYLRAVRRAGLAAHPAETPRELLGRARTLAVRPARLHRLERATEAHESSRYRDGIGSTRGGRSRAL